MRQRLSANEIRGAGRKSGCCPAPLHLVTAACVARAQEEALRSRFPTAATSARYRGVVLGDSTSALYLCYALSPGNVLGEFRRDREGRGVHRRNCKGFSGTGHIEICPLSTFIHVTVIDSDGPRNLPDALAERLRAVDAATLDEQRAPLWS